jgi:hypothetical protein
MFTTEQKRRLAALHNRLTSYEVVAVRADGTKALIGYTRRHSGFGARMLAQSKGAAILGWLGTKGDCIAKPTKNGWDFSDGTKITFTGRTERDAIQMGEIPAVDHLELAA